MVTRVLVGVALAAVAVALLLLGGWYLWGLVAVASVLCVYEAHHALGTRLISAKLPSYVFAALFVPARVIFGGEAALILLFCCAFAAFIPFALFGGEGGRAPMDAAFKGLFPLAYPMLFLYACLLVTLIPPPGFSSAFLLTLACPLVSDVFALFGGKLFGKRKLAPRVSPNKTVEGAVAGLIGGMLAGAAIFALQPLWGMQLGLAVHLALGLILSALGQMGDLFASALKRYCGIKDFGKLLPGHGGVLDRIDSVLFCAPAVYLFFKLVSF